VTLAAAAIEVRYADRHAVLPTTLTLGRGEMVALVGPNGAGKSSLLKALGGLIAHGGQVTWNGTRLADGDRARTIAYLPQDPPVHWPLKVRDLVALGRLPHRTFGAAASTADTAAVDHALRETGTLAFAERAVDRLSVGERARVLLARALAVEAPTLLVDEPVAMQDPHHQLRVMTTLRGYAAQGRLVVAVLHDLGLAARFCSRALLMDSGSVVADGPPATALSVDAIRAHYRIEPFVAQYAGEAVIVPWRALDA
jgi:iron complex transport system ATP-binding protein